MSREAFSEEVMAQACAWIARLQREALDEADGLEFAEWLGRSPAHGEAYERALSGWHEFEQAAEAVTEMLTQRARVEALRRPAISRRWFAAGGAALAAALAVAVVPKAIAPAPTDTYVTGKGEHRRLTLADGSVVDLNAESRLTVTLARNERRLTLSEGEALFDVTHDARRPFTVAAAGRVVRVVGTQFDVKNRPNGLSVTVARGKVQVRPAAEGAAGRAFLLTPGQRLDVSEAGAEALRAVDPSEAYGWRVGRLVYRNTPLADVVADMNRQFPQQVTISDPALAAMPITGVIVLDEPNAVMSRLTLMLPIRTVPSDRGLLLLRK